MKVLWFTHIIPETFLLHHGKTATGTGFWINELLKKVASVDDIDLAVAFRYLGRPQRITINNVQYFSISTSKYQKYINLIQPLANNYNSMLLRGAETIIETFKPDIIHVHGTESIFGLLKAHQIANHPLVISIQGLLSQSGRYGWAEKDFFEIIQLQSYRDIFNLFSLVRLKNAFKKKGESEKAMIGSADAVLGRSSWDRSFCRSVAPDTSYFHVDEIMREEFYSARWEPASCQKYRIFTSGRLTLAKGMHLFIEALAVLKDEYPTMTAYISGSNASTCEYRYLIRLAAQKGVADRIHFTGWIPAAEIVAQLLKANVYVNASYIENGCNALQEAMLIGVPCIAGFTGGIATTLEHRKTGLMYPRGESFMLADRIRELFTNNNLAVQLGRQASEKAHARHNPQKIVADLLNSYNSLLNIPHG